MKTPMNNDERIGFLLRAAERAELDAHHRVARAFRRMAEDARPLRGPDTAGEPSGALFERWRQAPSSIALRGGFVARIGPFVERHAIPRPLRAYRSVCTSVAGRDEVGWMR